MASAWQRGQSPIFAAAALLWTSLATAAPPALPTWLTLPANAKPEGDAVTRLSWDFDDLNSGKDQPFRVYGQRFIATIQVAGFTGEGRACYDAFAAALRKGGLTPAFDGGGTQPPQGTFRSKGAKGKQRWVHIWAADCNDVRLTAIEEGEPTLTHTVPPPARTDSKAVAGKGFAILPPLAGSTFERDDTLQELLIERPGDVEPVLVAGASPALHYVSPPGTSYAACQLAWADGMKRAGWRTWPTVLARNGVDARVFAQFASDGRDLWARVHCSDEGYELVLADVGAARQASALAKELQRDCKVVIQGVFFDTAKATLRPESEPALQRLHQLLREAPGLQVEIGGHTDAVGQRSDNQKLSEARAASVVAWLKAKGVEGGRLQGRGYADTVPVADNDSDLGRARNRRVEVRDVKCKARPAAGR